MGRRHFAKRAYLHKVVFYSRDQERYLMAKEVCKTCNGEGWVPHPRASEPGQPDSIKCSQCGGDGWIER